MIKIKEAVIVEGRYDKIRLSSLIDTAVIETGGFRVFNDKERISLIRKLAQSRGIIVFTDSDDAGLVIRNRIKGCVDNSLIKHAYIPEIKGKEKRKDKPSKQGLLGVEGVSDEIIISALIRCGATICDSDCEIEHREITKADFFSLGLSGQDNSALLRKELLKELSLPTYMSTKAMISALSMLMDINELEATVTKIKNKYYYNKTL